MWFFIQTPQKTVFVCFLFPFPSVLLGRNAFPLQYIFHSPWFSLIKTNYCSNKDRTHTNRKQKKTHSAEQRK